MKKLALAVTVASVAVAGVAQAKSGVYVEGAGGWVQQNSVALDGAHDNLSSVDKHHIGGRADIGYSYDINQHFGLGGEFGWGYYGKTTANDGFDAKSSAFDLLGVATAHVTPQFDIFGKAGVARNTFTISGNGLSDKTHNNYDPMVAVGAGYNFTPNMQANLTYSHIFGSKKDKSTAFDSDGADAPSINAVMVGLKYTF